MNLYDMIKDKGFPREIEEGENWYHGYNQALSEVKEWLEGLEVDEEKLSELLIRHPAIMASSNVSHKKSMYNKLSKALANSDIFKQKEK